MNPEAQEIFDRLVALEAHELTEADIAFLNARASYMTDEQKVKAGIQGIPTAGADTPKGKK